MNSHVDVPAAIGSPVFDGIAEEYDRIFTDSVIGKAQRSLVHAALNDRFYIGQRILELNCGTGEDAILLASQGLSVFACDVSSRMIQVARRKAAHHESRLPVTFAVCANEHLDWLRRQGTFDGALSNFGGFNCTPDLSSVAREMEKLVRPGGQFFLCMVGRFCLWEILWYCLRGRWGKAFRRLKRNGSVAHIGGNSVRVYYPKVRDVRAAFAPGFRLQAWRGIGVVLPPSWMEPFFRNRPGLVERLRQMDAWLGERWLFRGIADHILYRFVREGE
jgi:ubiquinone/menaquinone biosynthesis C-methylase UbiE